MKDITLSIIQFDAVCRAGNLNGIKTFLDEIEPLYKKFLHEYRWEDSEFKKEIHELIRYLFTDERIFHHAFDSVRKMQGSVTLTEENCLLAKQIYEVKRTIILPDPYEPAGGVEFKYKLDWQFSDPLSEFVLKYKGRYDQYNTSEYALYYAIKHKFSVESSFQKNKKGKVGAIKEAAKFHEMKGWKHFQTQYNFWEKICEERKVFDLKYSIQAGHIVTIEKALELLKGMTREYEFATVLLNQAKRRS